MTEDREEYRTYWTTKQLAEKARVTPRYIRQEITAKRITARRLGRDWFIPDSEAKRWLENRGDNQ